jgi:hypothetical protein
MSHDMPPIAITICSTRLMAPPRLRANQVNDFHFSFRQSQNIKGLQPAILIEEERCGFKAISSVIFSIHQIEVDGMVNGFEITIT